MATLKVTNIKNESFAGDQLYLKSDGKIGIGTASPQRHLVLYESASGQTQIQFQNLTTGTATTDGFSVGLDASEKGFIWNYEGTDTYIGGQGGTSITIKNDGKIGIGTTSPSQLLQLESTDPTIRIKRSDSSAYAEITSDTSGLITFKSDPSNSANLSGFAFTIDNSEKLRIQTDGDIEVGGNLKTNNLSGRNLVINGAMQVSQRGTSFSGSATPEYTLDRFRQANGSSWNFDTTTTQESAGPDGFSKSLKITPDTTDTPTAGENGVIDYFIEGQDLQHLAFGTSSAKKVTVSFYAKSSAQNNNHQYTLQMWHKNSGTSQFNINKAFTVTSTWQRFIITFPADTSNNMLDGSDPWAGRLTWILSSGPDDIASEVNTWTSGNLYKAVTGQSNFMDNTSNEFHLTGVQLEIGSIATEFEHRSYGDELARCKRYYEYIEPTDGWAMWSWQTDEGGSIMFFNEKRATPTASIIGSIANGVSPGSGSIGAYGVGGWRSLTSLSVSTTRKNSTRIFCGGMNLANAGDSFGLYFKTNTGIRLEAEL